MIINAIVTDLEPAKPADMVATTGSLSGMALDRATVSHVALVLTIATPVLAVVLAATTRIAEVLQPAGSEVVGKDYGVVEATHIDTKRAGLLPIEQRGMSTVLAGEIIQETTTDVFEYIN